MKRKKVLLVNLGFRTFTNLWVTPPMGLLVLAAYLRQRLPLEFRIVNQRLCNISNDEIIRQAVDFNADVVGFSALTTTANLLPELTGAIRRALPNVLQLIGGPYASAGNESVLLDNCADAAVVGEGERAFEAILQAYFEGDGLASVPAILWRTPDGSIRKNPGETEFIESLDDLPLPAYDLIQLPDYWRKQSLLPMFNRKYASLLGSRGCAYRCAWCHNIFGKRMRLHSPERMIEEITFLRKKYGISDFEFLDDMFNLNQKRVLAFCDLVHKNDLKLKLAFPNGLRGDILTEDSVNALVDAGMYMTQVALDTGSERLQEMTEKRLNIPAFMRGAGLVASHRVYLHVCAMLGFPTETEAELRSTVDTICRGPFHSASFFTVTPYPGTPLYARVMETQPEKLANLRYESLNSNTMRVNLTDLPDKLFYSIQRGAQRRFYANPARLLRLLRNHPQPLVLPAYIPMVLYRASKGLIEADAP